MDLTEKDVLNIAKLAKLELKEDEIKQYQRDMQSVLGYVETLNTATSLNEIEVANISGNESISREDIVKPSLSREKALLNAPAQMDGFIKVKNVMK